MIPEFAHLSAAIALGIAALIFVLGYWGSARNRPNFVDVTCGLAYLQLGTLALSFALLAWAFLEDDFSVLYIAENSHSRLPWHFKISAIWGAHEGSFLLWTVIMAAWTAAVARVGSRLPQDVLGYVLGTMGFLNFLFLLYLLEASNPFLRLVPNVPFEGADLNPVLQHFGQIIHPPMLYVGWVGSSVAFSFAIAGLLTRHVNSAWARWARPWCNAAWVALTVGITLGSWWAYHELGWGGWWFWDPVENASFMPWLAGTALVHSMVVTEKRDAFRNWSILLCLVTFGLCLMGAFLVRSGVLTSVHAFASDPDRGLFLLGIFVLTMGGGFAIFGIRVGKMRPAIEYAPWSRETLLMFNNMLLLVATGTVLVGTLFPLAYEVLTGGERLSVGTPYFNKVFVPIMGLLAVFLAFAPASRWIRTKQLPWAVSWKPLAVGSVCGICLPLVLFGWISLTAAIALAVAGWILSAHAIELARRSRSLTPGFVGMWAAHSGFAIVVIAIAITSTYSHLKQTRMAIGEEVVVNDQRYTFADLERVEGPTYVSNRARFEIGNATVFPEKRLYRVRNQVMTEGGIHQGLFGDRYISMGEPFEDGSWGIQIQDKPMIRWIWLGALLIAMGGALAIRRPRVRAGSALVNSDVAPVHSETQHSSIASNVGEQ